MCYPVIVQFFIIAFETSNERNVQVPLAVAAVTGLDKTTLLLAFTVLIKVEYIILTVNVVPENAILLPPLVLDI